MSRLTSAQVISLGEYLEPDFDPSTLTVSQLLGVLGFHNIRYPTPYTKGKLVQLFNDEIKPRASKFKRERTKNENSMASDDGIMDGITGEPLNGKTKVLVKCFEPLRWISITVGRSYATVFATLVGSVHSNRSTNASRTCVLYLIFRFNVPKLTTFSIQPKRRRSSAQPALGGMSRRKAVAPTEVTLVEESEPEEEDLPVKKVGRTKKKVRVITADYS